MSAKRLCKSCKVETSHELYHIDINNCNVCDGWNVSEMSWLLALKLKEFGFDWHWFAEKIDEMSKLGTAKELFMRSVEEDVADYEAKQERKKSEVKA